MKSSISLSSSPTPRLTARIEVWKPYEVCASLRVRSKFGQMSRQNLWRQAKTRYASLTNSSGMALVFVRGSA